MKIAYNPMTAAALTVAPSNNDITFDLPGLSIYVKGVKFDGKAYSIFKKYTSATAGGYNGLVPAPSYNDGSTNRFLKEDGTWGVPEGVGSTIVSSTASGLAPKIGTVAASTVTTQADEWVLTSTKGATPTWRKLPTNAFLNYYRPILVDGTSLLGNNNTALNIAAGTNINLTTDAGKVTINNGLTKVSQLTNDSGYLTTRGYIGTTAVQASSVTQSLTGIGNIGMSGRLVINTTITDHTQPTGLCLVINSAAIPEGTTLTLKNSPGIGFHISQSNWGSLVFNGNFNFINHDATTFMPVKASKFVTNGGTSSQFVKGDGSLDSNTYATTTSLENYVTLNTSLTITGAKTFNNQIISTVADGTAPFVVASKTLVNNLNADLLDGIQGNNYFGARGYLSTPSIIKADDINIMGIYKYHDNDAFKEHGYPTKNMHVLHFTNSNGFVLMCVDYAGYTFIRTRWYQNNASPWRLIIFNDSNIDGKYINALTGYIKAESPSDLVETDTLNIALGKLEYKAGIAYSWYRTITEDDTDEIINKWDEVVDFVNNLEVDLTEEFVTRKTDLVITGKKTFSGSGADLLTINRNNTDQKASWIRFKHNDTLVGYLGVSLSKNPAFSDGINVYNLLHTGNYSSYLGYIGTTPVQATSAVLAMSGISSIQTSNYYKIHSLSNRVDADGVNHYSSIRITNATVGNYISNLKIPNNVVSIYNGNGLKDSIHWNLDILSAIDTNTSASGAGVGIHLGCFGDLGRGAGVAAVMESGWYNTTGLAFYVNHKATNGYSEKVRLSSYGHILPVFNNGLTLGNTTNRWLYIYSEFGNFSGQITSTVANGTAPFVVSSKTLVNNLNALYISGISEAMIMRYIKYLDTDINNTVGNKIISYAGNVNPFDTTKSYYGAILQWTNNTNQAPSTSNSQSTWYYQLIGRTLGDANGLYFRRQTNGLGWSDIKEVAFTDSDITGNAATADKLKNKVKLWGNDFDGSNNVNGDISLGGKKIYWHVDPEHYYIGTSYTMSSQSTNLDYEAAAGHRFLSFNKELLRITTSGYVGVGTTDPKSKLDVNGSISNKDIINCYLDGTLNRLTIRMVDNTGMVYAFNENESGYKKLLIGRNDGTAITIAENGNVGIGTTNPNLKLSVIGNVYSLGYFLVRDSVYQGTSAGLFNSNPNDTWTYRIKDTDGTTVKDYKIPHYGYTIGWGRYHHTNGTDYTHIGSVISDFYGLNFHVGYSTVPIRFGYGSSYSDNLVWGTTLYGDGRLILKGTATATGFVKSGSSDSYVLLGGSGHKAISDFLLKSEIANQELSANLTTITKSLTVTANWMDTGIAYNNLPANGSYIVLVYVQANDSKGEMYSCYWSGVMTWFVTNPNTKTNDTETDEILLHRSGHGYHNTIYLRTVMTTGSDSSLGLKLLIAANKDLGAAYTYTFKFKRII